MLTNKEDTAFMVYICLKTRCSGKIRLNKSVIGAVAAQMNCSTRTIQNNIRRLRRWDWIGYNAKSGIYFVRGWQRITEIEKIQYPERSAAIFEIDELPELKEFLFAAYIQKLIRYKRAKQTKAAYQTRRAKQPEPCFHPFSIRYLAKIFKLSPRAIYMLKQSATKAGLIEYKANFEPTNYDVNTFRPLLNNAMPGENYVIRDHKIFLRKSDLIKSNVLILNKRKKSKQCINQNIVTMNNREIYQNNHLKG